MKTAEDVKVTIGKILDSYGTKPFYSLNMAVKDILELMDEYKLTEKNMKILSEMANQDDLLRDQKDESPVYDEVYLNECREKAKENLSKIGDVDKWLDEIRGRKRKDDKVTYHLNCDKCGNQFWSQEGFPTPQLCHKCSVPVLGKSALKSIMTFKKLTIAKWYLDLVSQKEGYCCNPIISEDICNVLAKKKTCKGCEYFMGEYASQKAPTQLTDDEIEALASEECIAISSQKAWAKGFKFCLKLI